MHQKANSMHHPLQCLYVERGMWDAECGMLYYVSVVRGNGKHYHLFMAAQQCNFRFEYLYTPPDMTTQETSLLSSTVTRWDLRNFHRTLGTQWRAAHRWWWICFCMLCMQIEYSKGDTHTLACQERRRKWTYLQQCSLKGAHHGGKKPNEGHARSYTDFMYARQADLSAHCSPAIHPNVPAFVCPAQMAAPIILKTFTCPCF